MIPPAARERLLEAMRQFDSVERSQPVWKNWEQRESYRYAISDSGKLYPVKWVIRTATGFSDFSGGAEANGYVESRGFTVVGLAGAGDARGALSAALEHVMEGYTRARQEESFGSPSEMYRHFERLPSLFGFSTAVGEHPTIAVSASCGIGNWANVPWISFLDRRETDTPQDGVYCVYLFRQDMSGVYLTLNQGVTKLTNDLGWSAASGKLRAKAREIRQEVPALASKGFSLSDDIALRVDHGLGGRFASSTIAHKLYLKGQVPSDSELVADLKAVFDAYTRYVTDKVGATTPQSDPRYWMIAAGEGARLWDDFLASGLIAIGWSDLGNLRTFGTREEITEAIKSVNAGNTEPVNNSLACWQFSREMSIGDFILVKRGRSTILGLGQITSDYRFDEHREEYKNVRSVRWIAHGEWQIPDEHMVTTKTLTDVTKYKEFLDYILPLIRSEHHENEYTLATALDDLFMDRQELEEILLSLRRRKNLVLQGPPGVGKTFVARRLAYLLTGKVAASQVEMVQFHQSYAYEDFIQGWRPDPSGGFSLKPGVFFDFCKRAQGDQSAPYVFIIDEINRGNLSKVFGELMMLIESDKRGPEFAIPLTYSEQSSDRFYLPPNLFIIGTLNTADRSLALVDYALRRRFTFVDLKPAFGRERFRASLSARGASSGVIHQICTRFEELNTIIANDHKHLGHGFEIGHSYFCNTDGMKADEAWYKLIVKTEVAPLLREYWFDAPEQAEDHIATLLV